MDKRTCSKCKIEQPVAEFNKKGFNKKGEVKRQAYCKSCHKVYIREWYKNNKKRQYENIKRYKRSIKEWLDEYRSKSSCQICGFKHPATIDFHHSGEEDKKFNISTGVNDGGSIAALQKELNKCIPLCCNCHRILHWKERQQKQKKE